MYKLLAPSIVSTQLKKHESNTIGQHKRKVTKRKRNRVTKSIQVLLQTQLKALIVLSQNKSKLDNHQTG